MAQTETSKHYKVSAITLRGLVNPHDPSADRQFSMNLARGIEVLRAFTPGNPILGNHELSSITGLPKPTISRLTYTLSLLGYLNHDSHLRKYRLGAGVLALGHPLLASMRVRQLAKPIMASLAAATGCSVNLGVRDRDTVVYIDSVRADTANQYLPDIGSSRPLLLSSIGRALIVSSPPELRTEIINYLKVLDPNAFRTAQALLSDDQKRFSNEGYCYSRGDWHPEVHAIAVPIRCPRGELPIAMNCTRIAIHADGGDGLRRVVPFLKDAAHQLEISQGLDTAHPM